MKAINAISGSAWLRTPCGQLVLFNPEGVECYRGKPDADDIVEHFKDEHPAIQMELLHWLRRADVLGSGFVFKPVNNRQLAPLVKPGNGGLRV